MLEKLIAKAKATDSRVWKWILGIAIGIGVFFLGWYLYRQKDKVAVLKADMELASERAEDAKLKSKNEESKALAEKLKKEADRFREKAVDKYLKFHAAKSKCRRAKEKIDEAKSWKELEQEARRV